ARTDEKPLSDPKFIMINIIPVIGCLAALFILGSPWVLAILWHVVEFIYKSIIMPAMKFGIYILSLIIPTIAYTGDTLEYYSIENRVDLAEYESLTAGTQTNHVVLAILLIAIAIFIGINLLRKYRHHKYASQGILEIRSTIKPMVEEPRSASKQSLFTPRDPRLAVRHHYRQFLKMCAEKGCPPEKGDTSKDINAKNKTNFSEKSITRLRELYIKARYSEHVIEIRDSKEAAGLVKQL
ncbi:MAG: hypothetical protein FWF04_00700, partial [Clostridiales bacterium]|nr:hypothetical protein [Clostridiales bacterium]